jgi:hypothetical protein
MVGIPEVFTVAAIAILGKSGFNMIKERISRIDLKGAIGVVNPMSRFAE